MANLANITLRQEDYNNLLANGAFIDVKIISVKIMPDDSELKDDLVYNELVKKRSKATKELDEYRFQKITNK